MSDGGAIEDVSADSAQRELLEEAKALRRKLNFWRKMAAFMVGVILLVLVVIWQRGREDISMCRAALSHYAQVAQARKLEAEALNVLETQWRALPVENAKLASDHYHLIAGNWRILPKPHESIPLAVCQSPHEDLIFRGRHVLERDQRGLHTRWVSEGDVAPILNLTSPMPTTTGVE